MLGVVSSIKILAGDRQADRIVPPTGFTARLTLFTAAAMAFLSVFALALSLASGRLASRWGEELAQSSTVRISAPSDQLASQTQAALRAAPLVSGTPVDQMVPRSAPLNSAQALRPNGWQAAPKPAIMPAQTPIKMPLQPL